MSLGFQGVRVQWVVLSFFICGGWYIWGCCENVYVDESSNVDFFEEMLLVVIQEDDYEEVRECFGG